MRFNPLGEELEQEHEDRPGGERATQHEPRRVLASDLRKELHRQRREHHSRREVLNEAAGSVGGVPEGGQHPARQGDDGRDGHEEEFSGAHRTTRVHDGGSDWRRSPPSAMATSVSANSDEASSFGSSRARVEAPSTA